MNPALPEEAEEFGATAERAFAGAGGIDLARKVEADPGLRTSEVAGLLGKLGADDLDAASDIDSACAAAELCRAAGAVALPFPVAGWMLRGETGIPVAVVRSLDAARVDHGDVAEQWRVATLDGDAAAAGNPSAVTARKLGPFVSDLQGSAPGPGVDAREVDLWLTLGAFTVLGALERAVAVTVEHVNGREQFGQKIAGFQSVQFQLADAAVAVAGVREVCRFALWRVFDEAAGSDARPDALAARLAALDAARFVLRTSQQLHGAAGVCDEYDVSILARHSQPLLRLPFGAERTATELASAVGRSGFAGLFAQ